MNRWLVKLSCLEASIHVRPFYWRLELDLWSKTNALFVLMVGPLGLKVWRYA